MSENCTRCAHHVFFPKVDLEDFRIGNVHYESPQGMSIAEFAQHLCQDLELCESEMYHLEERLNYLKGHKHKIERCQLVIGSSSALIHRLLPDELLLEIFGVLCEENSILIQENGPTLPPQALSVSAFCRKWRQILLSPSCAHLWASITYVDPRNHYDDGYCDCSDDGDGRPMNSYKKVVDLYCKRSEDLPLTLNLATTDWFFHPVIRRLGREAHRWKNLSLTVRGRNEDHLDVQGWSVAEAPNLESLSIENYTWKDTSTDVEEGVAPHGICFDFLSSVDESSSLYTIRSTSVLLDTGGVSFLNVTTPTCHANLIGGAILDSCANVREVVIHCVNDWEEGNPRGFQELDEGPSPLRLERLESLCIVVEARSGKRDLLGVILNSLELPALTSLCVRHDHGSGDRSGSLPTPATHIQSFLARSNCSLRTLVLDRLSLGDEEAVALLEHLPDLVELSLLDPEPVCELAKQSSPDWSITLAITPQLIQSLHSQAQSTLRHSTEPFLPALYCLTLLFVYIWI